MERRGRSLQRRSKAASDSIIIILLLFLPPLSFYIGYSRSIAKYKNKVMRQKLPKKQQGYDEDCSQKDATKKDVYERRFTQLANNHIHEDPSIISHRLFPQSASDYATAMLRVSREELLKSYDIGLPHAPMARGSDALIIYNNVESIPDDLHVKRDALYNGGKTSVSTALSNCDSLNIIYTDTGHQRPGYQQCMVVVGNNIPSYHQNRYERLPPMNQSWENRQYNIPKFESSAKLRHINRASVNDGKEDVVVPVSKLYQKQDGAVHEHWKSILTFIDNIDQILDELKVIVEPILKDNTVVVMTVNRGQSILLSNFVCSARSRGLDITNILVFPTDLEAQKVAEGLGLATYFDKINLGSLPEGEAGAYGDDIFASMMFAKMLTVLYISLLGHDVLFQDVDIVWMKNPLTFFHDKSNKELQKFDILCQDDGSVQARFAPLQANSGFYYVRANKKTQYLFTSLLYHNVLVALSGSHQQVMIQLMQEHSSLFGLEVKVFDKDETEYFPSGWHLFRRRDFMKKLVKGESDTYIYHSCWTTNKRDKLMYLKQLGEWYVQDKCDGRSVDEILGPDSGRGELARECCSAESLVQCYYSDLASKVPCRDSPKHNGNGKDFWEE